MFTALPAALPEKRVDPAPWGRPKRQPLGERFIRDLFALARRCDLRDEADEAARLIVRHPGSASPDRTLPAALRELYREEGLVATTAYGSLWRRATDVLLARNSTPPAEPRDWSIAADVACDCDLCRSCASSARTRSSGKRAFRYARICATTSVSLSNGTNSIWITKPSVGAGPIPSSAPRTARATSDETPST